SRTSHPLGRRRAKPNLLFPPIPDPPSRISSGMKLISVNVGRPRIVLWKGTQVSTAIFKSPVEGAIEAKQLNLDGDRQADLSVHGNPYKAVYDYPSEHYPYCRH